MGFVDIQSADELSALIDENRSRTVLIYGTAAWCGPCVYFGPVLERAGERYDDDLIVARVDVDEVPDAIDEWNIVAFPTVIAVIDAQAQWLRIGAAAESDLDALLGPVVRAGREGVAHSQEQPDDGAIAGEKPPASLTVPLDFPAEITLAGPQGRLRSGDAIEFDGSEGLAARIVANPWNGNLPFHALAAIPLGVVEMVSVTSPELSAASIAELVELVRPESVQIRTNAPLGSDVIDALSRFCGLSNLDVDAPGVDVWELSGMFPTTTVNGMWWSAELRKQLSTADVLEVRERSAKSAVERLGLQHLDAAPATGIVLVNDWRYDAPDDVLAALAAEDDFLGYVERRNDLPIPEPSGSALVRFENGIPVAVRSAADLASVAQVKAPRGNGTSINVTRESTVRSVTIDEEAAVTYVIVPSGDNDHPGWALAAGETVEVPAGWRVSVGCVPAQLGELKPGILDQLYVSVGSDETPPAVAIAAIATLVDSGLRHLTLVRPQPEWLQHPALSRLADLATLTIFSPDLEEEEGAERLLPFTLINDTWTREGAP